MFYSVGGKTFEADIMDSLCITYVHTSHVIYFKTNQIIVRLINDHSYWYIYITYFSSSVFRKLGR